MTVTPPPPALPALAAAAAAAVNEDPEAKDPREGLSIPALPWGLATDPLRTVGRAWLALLL